MAKAKRPSEQTRKSRPRAVGLRATEEDFKAWCDAAIADGRTLSAWIERRCNGEPAKRPRGAKR